MKASVLLSTVVCGLVALPTAALAQDQIWLRDRRYTEGPGYRVGDFELHPGAAAEFGFDSNYLHRPTGDANFPVLPALRLRLTPSFSVSTLSRQRREGGPGAGAPNPSVEFRGGVALTYNEFFPLVTAPSSDVLRAQRNLGASVDLGLTILPGRPWSGALNLSYLRALTPTDQGVVFQADGKASQLAFNRNLPRGTAEIVWTPGSGLFEWRLGYAFSGSVFEATEFNKLTNVNNAVTTRGRWRFLPRTALVYDASFGFISYTSPESIANGGKLSSHPLRTRLGVNGLITPSFALLAMVGWGASFYTPSTGASAEYTNQNFDSVIGQLELKWFITPNPSADPNTTTNTLSSVAVGFSRDFFDSFIGNYFERDRGYLAFNYFYGGKFLLVIDGGAAPIIYPKMKLKGITEIIGPFTDIRIDASLLAEYRFKDQFGVNLSFRYNENINKVHLPVTSGGNPDDLSFRQIEVYGGFRWLM